MVARRDGYCVHLYSMISRLMFSDATAFMQVLGRVGERKRDRIPKATQHHQENTLGTLTLIDNPITVHRFPTRITEHTQPPLLSYYTQFNILLLFLFPSLTLFAKHIVDLHFVCTYVPLFIIITLWSFT